MQYSIEKWLKEDDAEVMILNARDIDAVTILCHTPDIVIFDGSHSKLPFIEFMKQTFETKQKYSDVLRMETPVLFLSGNNATAALSTVSELGETYFLDKPLNRSKLGWAVRKILDGTSSLSSKWKNNKKKSICIVDKDDKFQEFMSTCFSLNGFRVSEAIETEELVNNINQMDYKIVILDLMLNESKAFNSIKKIIEISPEVVILGTLPINDQNIIQEAYNAGMKEHFIKPIPLLPFVKKVKLIMKSTQK